MAPAPQLDKDKILKELGNLGVSKAVVGKIDQAMEGNISGEALPQHITLRKNTTIDLAHADHEGCISFNPESISQGLRARFGENHEKTKLAANKIFEEELLHAVHQTCPGYTKAAKLFGDAALEGDIKPLQAVATALSLYRRCQGGTGRIAAGDLLVNPELLEQGFGELLRMCAQYKMTGTTTEMTIKPWNARQQQDLQQISDNSISKWCQELETGTWGLRCRNQYRLLCKVLEAE